MLELSRNTELAVQPKALSPEFNRDENIFSENQNFELEKMKLSIMEADEDIQRYKAEKYRKLQEKEFEKQKVDVRRKKWDLDLMPIQRNVLVTNNQQNQEFECPTGNSQRQHWKENNIHKPNADENILEEDEAKVEAIRRQFELQLAKDEPAGSEFEKNDGISENGELRTLECVEDQHGHTSNQMSRDVSAMKTSAKVNQGNTPSAEPKPSQQFFERNVPRVSAFGQKRPSCSRRGSRLQALKRKSQPKRHKPLDEELLKTQAAQKVFMEDLKKGMVTQRKNREEMQQYLDQPIGILTEIMSSYLVGKPKRDSRTGILLDNHLPHTDITKVKNIYIPPQKKNYCSDLVQAAEERHRIKELKKLKDLQEEIKHHEVFYGLFGRAGGGAPLKDTNRKRNLNNLLYSSGNSVVQNPCSQSLDETRRGQTRRQVLRNCSKSKHTTLYDYTSDNNTAMFNYTFEPPWGTYE